MKILKANQIRKADRYTIEHEPIKSIDLMERASTAFVEWFEDRLDKKKPVRVFCGTGNNGGDGLAISRMLLKNGWDVATYVVKMSGKQSEDFSTNYTRLEEALEIQAIEHEPDLQRVELNSSNIAIDAIFGSGLTRPAEGVYAQVIDFINNSGAGVVAVDIPSGLFCDSHSSEGAIIKADYVVSFQMPKMAFLMPGNSDYVKNWVMVDIGLSNEFIQQEPTSFEYLEKPFVKSMLKTRGKYSHKTNFGRVVLITGSWGKMGAAVLCSRACLRIGAGLVTVHAPSCGYQILQTAVPEAMVSVDKEGQHTTSIPGMEAYSNVGVGLASVSMLKP